MLPPGNLYHTDNELTEKILAYIISSDAEKKEQRECMLAIACANFDINSTCERMREIIDETASTKQR
jgi:hypothetical protein